MKKIATLTFHWATNYGAVLQAFALQRFLQKNGYETEIINYVPRRVKAIQRMQWIASRKFLEFRKERCIAAFRKRNLMVSEKLYPNNKSLYQCSNQYDAIICGSDQIWNTSFTSYAEGKTTLSYFLNFAGAHTKRIAYAVSFGTDKVPEDYIQAVKSEVEEFSAVSVRERTGLEIAKQIGTEAILVSDPTILLEKEEYERLIEKTDLKYGPVFSYIIHDNQSVAAENSNYVKARYQDEDQSCCPIFGMEEWLGRIRSAEMVVTNSFHGVMLSIIFNRPFIAVLIPGSGMNDRIRTVLERVGLSERCVETFDRNQLDRLCDENINWHTVNEKLDALRKASESFLLGSLTDRE